MPAVLALNPLDAYRDLPPTYHALRVQAKIEKEIDARIHDPSRARDHLHDLVVLRDMQDFVAERDVQNAASASDDRPMFFRMARSICGLTHPQLSTISGISATTIRKYELSQTLYRPSTRPLQISETLVAACLYHRAYPAPNPFARIPLEALLTFIARADLCVNGIYLPDAHAG